MNQTNDQSNIIATNETDNQIDSSAKYIEPKPSTKQIVENVPDFEGKL